MSAAPRPATPESDPTKPRRRPALGTAARAALPLAVLLLPGAVGCVCRPSAAELVGARSDSPLHTIEAFATYARAGLYEREYFCFSSDFTRRNGLSYAAYGDARERLQREHPVLAWLARSSTVEVLAVEAVDEARHRVDVAVGGRTLRVWLVREDLWRIWRGELLVDGRAPFETTVSLEHGPDGTPVWNARIPADPAETDPAAITSLIVERLWKIDDIQALEQP